MILYDSVYCTPVIENEGMKLDLLLMSPPLSLDFELSCRDEFGFSPRPDDALLRLTCFTSFQRIVCCMLRAMW